MENLEALRILNNPNTYYNTPTWCDALFTIRKLIEKDRMQNDMYIGTKKIENKGKYIKNV